MYCCSSVECRTQATVWMSLIWRPATSQRDAHHTTPASAAVICHTRHHRLSSWNQRAFHQT